MTETKRISEIESWQKAEDERLEYEGYCNKIRKGLEDLDENSGERAIWELIQNSRDMSHEARIKIELTNKDITFSHHGRPFDYTSFRALVKQDSSKDKTGAEQVGQYGTGFMTTHAFNRTVYISGPFPDFVNASPKLGFVSQDIKKRLDGKLLFSQEECFCIESQVLWHPYSDCRDCFCNIKHMVDT